MKKIFSVIFFLTLLFFTPKVFGQVAAGYFTFDPTSSTAANGATFQVNVVVNAGSEQVRSADIYVTYDSTLLEAQSVSAGTFFPTVTNNITSGRVYVAAMVDDGATTKTGSGTVATITFKGLKEGTGTISFECDSSLIAKADANGTNVLDCTANGTHAVTIGSGSSTDDLSGTVATPTQLPKSGSFDNIAKWSQWGLLLVVLGVMARLLLL